MEFLFWGSVRTLCSNPDVDVNIHPLSCSIILSKRFNLLIPFLLSLDDMRNDKLVRAFSRSFVTVPCGTG